MLKMRANTYCDFIHVHFDFIWFDEFTEGVGTADCNNLMSKSIRRRRPNIGLHFCFLFVCQWTPELF